jgi:hypothetical protein
MNTFERTDTPPDSLHEIAGIQNYAMQVGQVADALSKGDALTSRLIAAVHSGDSFSVQRVFAEVGVDTRVELTSVDASDLATGDEPADAGAVGAGAQLLRLRRIVVSIGIGPISISVDLPKSPA